jgi:hypothetical protein
MALVDAKECIAKGEHIVDYFKGQEVKRQAVINAGNEFPFT